MMLYPSVPPSCPTVPTPQGGAQAKSGGGARRDVPVPPHFWNRFGASDLTRIPSGIWSCLYGSFQSALNTYRAWGAIKYTWSKVWPLILILVYLIRNFAPIFGQHILISDPSPLHGLFGLSWSELSPYEWKNGVGCKGGGLGLFFSVTDGQKCDY